MSKKPVDNGHDSRHIVVTLDIHPVDKGQRRIVASAAFPGELPLIEVGTFADLQGLITRTWLGVQKRKVKPVTVKADKPAAEAPEGEGVATAAIDGDEPSDNQPTATPDDQLVVTDPVIEGDDAPADEPQAVPSAPESVGTELAQTEMELSHV